MKRYVNISSVTRFQVGIKIETRFWHCSRCVMSSHESMPVWRSNEERSVLYSLNLMYESNLRRARTFTQGRLTIKFAVCESEEWATGDGRRRIRRWGVWWWFTISRFSIINVPLSLRRRRRPTGLFTSSAVLMDVKPDGPPGLTGDLQLYYDISAGISGKRDVSNQGLNSGCDVSELSICWWKKNK